MATFAKIKMMSEDVNSLLLTGKFKANSQLARVEDGAIVVVGDLMDSTVYANNKDMNVFEIGAPAAADTDEVAIVDIVDVSKGDVYGDAWRLGVRTDSLFAEPGQPVRVRILKNMTDSNSRLMVSRVNPLLVNMLLSKLTALSSFPRKTLLLLENSVLRSKWRKISL